MRIQLHANEIAEFMCLALMLTTSTDKLTES